MVPSSLPSTGGGCDVARTDSGLAEETEGGCRLVAGSGVVVCAGAGAGTTTRPAAGRVWLAKRGCPVPVWLARSLCAAAVAAVAASVAASVAALLAASVATSVAVGCGGRAGSALAPALDGAWPTGGGRDLVPTLRGGCSSSMA